MTTSKEELAALVERVRGLKGTDREVDWRIADATNHPSFEKRFEHMWPPFGPKSKLDRDIPAYTASVDAALALVERVQPGFSLRMATPDTTATERNPMGRAAAELVPNLHNDDAWKVGIKSASGPTLPIAIVLALLLSLQSQEPTNGL